MNNLEKAKPENGINLNSYNQIAKATGIFGGVQIINIVISVIRSKFVAILLGATGVGIIGMLTSTTGIISSLTNFGINFSAVRTIAQAESTNNSTLLSRTIITVRRWVLLTGTLGALFTIIFANNLSHWIFGNNEYTWAFTLLSLIIFFQGISNGQLAILQGLRELKQLAKANVLGSVFGLLSALPLYYYLRIKGIVPSIIVTSILALILSSHFARKIKVERIRITIKESFYDGFDMIRLGGVIMVTNFALLSVMYLVQLFINRIGGLEQVGLYLAATTIISGYIGLVFSSMLPEFLPRLSTVVNDDRLTNRMVSQQTEIAILVLGPILILLLSTLPLVINILYNDSFISTIQLIKWAIPGIIFMAASWTSGIMIIAKGDFKLFLILELCTDVFILTTNVVFYYFFQLEGLGVASLINNFFRLLIQFIILRKKYSFSFDDPCVRIFITQLALTSCVFFIVWFFGFPRTYLLSPVFLITSVLYSFYELKKRIDFNEILSHIRKK